jgi:hypothetical protein
MARDHNRRLARYVKKGDALRGRNQQLAVSS